MQRGDDYNTIAVFPRGNSPRYCVHTDANRFYIIFLLTRICVRFLPELRIESHADGLRTLVNRHRFETAVFCHRRSRCAMMDHRIPRRGRLHRSTPVSVHRPRAKAGAMCGFAAKRKAKQIKKKVLKNTAVLRCNSAASIIVALYRRYCHYYFFNYYANDNNRIQNRPPSRDGVTHSTWL